jgi:putative MATE family efflux protein
MGKTEKATLGEKSRVTRDWTQGNITQNLLSLSWPMMVTQALSTIGPLIDMVWVGKLGAASVAGVGVAGMAVLLVNASLSGLTMGMRVAIGRSFGAGNKETAVHYARQYFAIGTVYSLIMAVLGILFADRILLLLGVDAAVIQQGKLYLQVQFLGVITMTVLSFNDGTMQASGDTMIPMRIAIVYRVLHLILCPLFVFGIGYFPELGVRGAALSNIITQGLGGIIGLWVLFKGYSRLQINFKNWRFDASAVWQMIKVGLPNSFMAVQQILSMLFLVAFIAPFGTKAVAAHTIFQQIDGTLLIMIMSIGMSAGVLGAQNMGAGKPERAAKSGWVAGGFTAVFMAVVSIIILLWADQISRIFNSDPELVHMSATFLRIACASNIALGLSAVLRHFLSGVGDTLAAFIMEIVCTWGLLIPLVWASTSFTDFGIWGIRWALVIRLIIGGIVFTLYFWSGWWKHRKI